MNKKNLCKCFAGIMLAFSLVVTGLPFGAGTIKEVKAAETITTTYAYDCQRSVTYPKRGQSVTLSSFDLPRNTSGTKLDANNKNWFLVPNGKYNATTYASTGVPALVSSLATKYGIPVTSFEVYKLYHTSVEETNYIGYALLVATCDNGYLALLEDTKGNSSGGYGYYLTNTEPSTASVTVIALNVASTITSVAITDIDAPVAGTALDTAAACATLGIATTAPTVSYNPADTTAAYSTAYTASVTLTSDTNYEWAETVAATVNGNAAIVTKNNDGTITVTYGFSATEQMPEHVHDWKDEWAKNETHHWHECANENCPVTENSQKDGYVEHTFGEWETKANKKERTCAVCDYKETESISVDGNKKPVEPTKTAPKTGDASMAIVWFALLAVSGCSVYFYKKRTAN